MPRSPSIVPDDTNRDVYLVLDDLDGCSEVMSFTGKSARFRATAGRKRLIAAIVPTIRSIARAPCSPNRPRQGCRSRGRRTGRSQIRRGTDVVMSGIVVSGRESGHGDIDANHPKRPSMWVGTHVVFTSAHHPNASQLSP